MAAASPTSPRPADDAGDSLPVVRLEVRAGPSSSTYPVGETGFLLGSVPGCDLRLPGSGLPPVLALVSRQAGGVRLRKLAPIGVLLLNGDPVGDSSLEDGDRLSIGILDITVRITSVPVLRVRLFEEQRKEPHLDEQLHEQEQAQDEERAAQAAQRHELGERERSLAEHQAELERVRRELGDIRQQLYQRYRQRRDRLAGQQEAVRRAARRLQERQRDLADQLRQSEAIRSDKDSVEGELHSRAAQLADLERRLHDREQLLKQRELSIESDLSRRTADLTGRENRLDEDRQSLVRSQTQHQTDLVRLDRLAASLEQRQRQMQRTALETDRRYEALQRDTRDLEEQAAQLDEWRSHLQEENETQQRKHQESETGRAELAGRAAALEGQQAMLATLRTRLERLREEHRRQEQRLDEQRIRQDAAESEIAERLGEARRLTQELHAEKKLTEEQQKGFEERQATLEAAVGQLRQAQDRIDEEGRLLEQRCQEQDDRSARQAEQEAFLEARTRSVEEELERLRLERQMLEERQANLARSEQVMTALQEQLRKRNDDLGERQKRLDEQTRLHEAEQAALDGGRGEFERQKQESEQQLATARTTLEQQQKDVAVLRADLDERERALRAEVQELVSVKEQLGTTRQLLEQEQTRLLTERDRIISETAVAKAEADALRQQLPDLEAQASQALERLALAREQLREHLAEIHAYARDGRADLEGLREGVGREELRLREQEQLLRQARDVHRLAVAEFRQQLIEWQGQLAELKRGLAQGEERLERRLSEVEDRARAIAATSQQLAQQAEELQLQERQVVERRQEVDRHLIDMREWYRKKIRELSGVDAEPPEDGVECSPPPLSTVREVEPGDRQMGELLRSLELIDAESLTALQDEARRQRRSLRQLLLQGGYLTLFQMALIEAGNLDGLVMGPVRVIDRLRSTACEAAYRVFDPRRERECLLRILDENELQDAVRPDEFRQRFAAAAEVSHPNLAATYEILEIAGRPAVLQEWLSGLSSSDWPALSAVPGVWFRLVSQAALGLQTAHQAGLVHGHLHLGQVVMTAEGLLKLCGLGEPAWLERANEENELPRGAILTDPTPADDLTALGRCALAWSMPAAEKKGSKAKPLPESLQVVLRRLCVEEGEPFQTARSLLDELDAAGAAVPANAAAWERFVKFVGEQSADTPLRRSA